MAQFPPAFIGECQKALDWANELVIDWLITGMFTDESVSDRQKIDASRKVAWILLGGGKNIARRRKGYISTTYPGSLIARFV